MRPGVLIDTGPLVAYLSPRDNHHSWAVETLENLAPPIVTCEPVLTEACFLVARNRLPAAAVLEPVERGRMRVGLLIEEEMAAICALMRRYENVPMSLADACLVRLAEMTGLPICTLDRDFEVYRAHRRRELDLIIPPGDRALHEP
jgi:predicted nucleic acid-binding protein